MHPVNINRGTFLYVSRDVFVQALLKCCFIKFSAAFVDVRSFVHNSSTETFGYATFNSVQCGRVSLLAKAISLKKDMYEGSNMTVPTSLDFLPEDLAWMISENWFVVSKTHGKVKELFLS